MKMYFPNENIDEDGIKRHALFSTDMRVTWEQHFRFLSSPKACLEAGINHTEERARYENEYEWFDFPKAPEVDPEEELWV